jgi:hypothetical protein
VSDPNSPLGIWATEENKGNVRIEQCGSNLCGYAVKSGEKILISMKPEGGKWTGRIHDPDSGRNYDSTMAMKGTTTLRVQGCAFGGMFCGSDANLGRANPDKGTLQWLSNGVHRSNRASLQIADRDHLCFRDADDGLAGLYAGAGTDVHRRCDAALQRRDSRCRSRHRLHDPEARVAERWLQGGAPIRAPGSRDAGELRTVGKARQADQPGPAQARLNSSPIRSWRHVRRFRTWRLIVLGCRDNKRVTFIPHSARRG